MQNNVYYKPPSLPSFQTMQLPVFLEVFSWVDFLWSVLTTPVLDCDIPGQPGCTRFSGVWLLLYTECGGIHCNGRQAWIHHPIIWVFFYRFRPYRNYCFFVTKGIPIRLWLNVHKIILDKQASKYACISTYHFNIIIMINNCNIQSLQLNWS